MVTQVRHIGAEQVHDRDVGATKRRGFDRCAGVEGWIGTAHQPGAGDEAVAFADDQGVELIIKLVDQGTHHRCSLRA